MWTKGGEYYMTNGTHNISKSFVRGVAHYRLWRLTTEKYKPNVLLGTFDSFDEAKAFYQTMATNK